MFTRRSNNSTATSGGNNSGNAATGAGAAPSLFARTVQNSIRPPSTTYTRQQHIDSYFNDAKLKPSTRKVSQDDSTFDTVFQSVAGDTLILRVHWPSTTQQSMFQPRPPAMTLAGVEAKHPWLDTQMKIVGYPPIQNMDKWKNSNLLLGQAVHAVVQHLQLYPPQIIKFVDPGLISIQQQQPPPQSSSSSNGHHTHHHPPPPSYHTSMSTSNNQQRYQQAPQQAIPDIDLPKIPNTFDELNNYNDREKLEILVKDELEFKAFCNTLTITQEYNVLQQSVIEENAKIAKNRLDKFKNEWMELHEDVEKLQKELQQKVHVFHALEKKQDKICKPPNIRKVKRDLNKSKKQAFDESEKMAEDWLDSDDCNLAMEHDFLDNFLEIRKLHHARAAKLELLENHQTR